MLPFIIYDVRNCCSIRDGAYYDLLLIYALSELWQKEPMTPSMIRFRLWHP